VTDNRGKRYFEIDEHPEFRNFDEFNPGNPIKAYIGWKGFFIFDNTVNLLDSAVQYIERVAGESCGNAPHAGSARRSCGKKLEALAGGKVQRLIWTISRFSASTSSPPPCAGLDRPGRWPSWR
jgi:formate dehydrogenase beta subunit